MMKLWSGKAAKADLKSGRDGILEGRGVIIVGETMR